MGKDGTKPLQIFLAGVESRHWIPSLMVSDEAISCGRMALEKWGGMTKVLRNIARIFSNHSIMRMLIRKDCSRISVIFCWIQEHLLFAEQEVFTKASLRNTWKGMLIL